MLSVVCYIITDDADDGAYFSHKYFIKMKPIYSMEALIFHARSSGFCHVANVNVSFATDVFIASHCLEFNNENKFSIYDSARLLSSSPEVEYVHPLVEHTRAKRFDGGDDAGGLGISFTDELYTSQWHLHDSYNHYDVNVVPAWMEGFTGLGVVIGVVDDGLEHAHQDLTRYYRADLSYDFNYHKPDPTPTTTADSHGTAAAGTACATEGNVCGVGVAYHASVSGLRILSKVRVYDGGGDG